MAHNLIEAEKLKERTAFYSKYLRPALSKHLWDALSDQILEGSEAAKEANCAGVLVYLSYTGQILKWLLDEFAHFSAVDRIKIAGAEESVAELRWARRPKEGPEGVWVLDYTPIYKLTISQSETVLERFTDDQHFDIFPGYIDEDLCQQIRDSGGRDFRQDLFFGSSLVDADCRVILKYGEKTKQVPLQLLPKYGGLIRKESWRDLDKQQEAMTGLLKGAREFDRNKGPVSPYLINRVQWAVLDSWKRESTTQFRDEEGKPQRVSRERLEGSGGRLDDPIMIEGEPAIKKDLLKAEGLDPEQKLLRKEAAMEMFQGDTRLLEIVKKRYTGERLSAPDRQYKHRVIEKIKTKVGI